MAAAEQWGRHRKLLNHKGVPMKRPYLPLALAAMFAGNSGVHAQELTLPEYTMEQRWERLGFLMVGMQAAAVALGESKGMSPEEVGEFIGHFFATSWLGGAEAGQYVTGVYRNFMAMPGAAAEVLSSSPTAATVRFNRPDERKHGPGRRTMGVSAESIQAMNLATNKVVAEWVGVAFDQRSDGDFDIATFETEYGPIVASEDIRWARGSYLSWLNTLQLLSMRMQDGMSAAEVGAANAELYGPTWNARTPWRLFRGMVWNQMTDPDFECEVLSASPTEVRARCRQQYVALVTQNEARFGVTAQDVFESGRAFASGIAEQMGLRWTETLEGEYRVITVTQR